VVSVNENVWLERRKKELREKFRYQVTDEKRLEALVTNQAQGELQELSSGIGTPQDQLRFQATAQGISVPAAASTPQEGMSRGNVTPFEAANDLGFGWRSPLEWAKGMVMEQPLGAETRPQYGVARREAYTGYQNESDWSSGSRATDAALNFMWNFYDTFTVFGGPIQKFIEKKTNLNVYPDWTENVQDSLVRSAGLVGGAAGLILPMMATAGTHTAVAGGVTAATKWGTLGKVLRMSPMQKLFGLGRKIAPKVTAGVIQKGLKKTGIEVAKAGTTQRFVGEVTGKAIGKKATEGASKSYGRLLSDIVWGAKEKQVIKRLAHKDTYAQAMEAAKTFAKRGVGQEIKLMKSKGIKIPGLAAENIDNIIESAFKTRTYDKVMDFATSRLGKQALGMIDHGLATGFAMAMHGGAKSAAELTAAEVPISSQVPIIANTALSSLGTGMMFSVIGQIPNFGKGSGGDALGTVLRGLGLTNKAAGKFTQRLATTKRALGSGLKPSDIAKKQIAGMTGTPADAMDKGAWWFPNKEKLLKTAAGRAKIENWADYIKKEILTGRSPIVGKSSGQFQNIIKDVRRPGMISKLADEVEQWQHLHRMSLIRHGATGTLQDFGSALPRMLAGSVLMHAPEIIKDREFIEEHPEDFLHGMLMTAYFTRSPSNPYTQILKTENGFKNRDLEYARKTLHYTGLFFPEVFRNEDFAKWAARYSNGTIVGKDMSQDARAQEILDVIEIASGDKTKLGSETIRMQMIETEKDIAATQKKETFLRRKKKTALTYSTLRDSLLNKQARLEKEDKKLSEHDQARLKKYEAGVTSAKGEFMDEYGKPVVAEVEEEISLSGDALANHYLSTEGKRWAFNRTMDAIDGLRGPRARGGSRLVDTSRWSDSQRWRVYTALQEHFGTTGILNPNMVTDVVDAAVVDNDVLTMRSIMYDSVMGTHNEMNERSYRVSNPSRIVVTGDKLGLTLEDYENMATHNEFLGYFAVNGGPEFLAGSRQILTEEKIAQYKAEGIELAAQVGQPDSPVRHIKTKADLEAFRLAWAGGYDHKTKKHVPGFWDGAMQRWEKFSGAPGETLREHTVREYLVNRAAYGSVVWSRLFHTGEIERIPVIIDKAAKEQAGTFYADSQKIPTASVSDFRGLFLESGIVPGTGKRKIVRNIPNYEDLPKEFRNTLPGLPDGTDQYYLTKKGRWEILQSYVDTLPFLIDNYDRGSKEQFTKTEFSGPEMDSVKNLLNLMQNTGLALPPSHYKEVRNHVLRKRYSGASNEEIAFLSASDELGAFDFFSGLYKIPGEIGFKKGKGLAGETVFANLKKTAFYKSEAGQEMLRTLQSLYDRGIIQGIEGGEGDIILKDTFGKEGGLKLNGEEAFQYLTSVFRAQGVVASRTAEQVTEDLIKKLNTKELRESNKDLADFMTNDIAKIAKGNPKQTYKFIRILEQEGVIKTVSPDGIYDEIAAEKLLTPRMRERMESFVLGSTLRNFDKATDVEVQENIDIVNEFMGKVVAKSKKGFQVPISRFIEESGIPDNILTDVVMETRDGKLIKDGLSLRDYIFDRTVAREGDPKTGEYHSVPGLAKAGNQYLSSLNGSKWHSIHYQLKNLREVEEIKFSKGTEILKDGEDFVELEPHNRVVSSKTRVYGSRLIDEFSADGLRFVNLGGKISTDRIKKPYNQMAAYEEVEFNADPNRSYDELINLYDRTFDSQKIETVKRGRHGIAERGELNDIYVPIGPSGKDRGFMLVLPRVGGKGSEYEAFYGKMREIHSKLSEIRNKISVDKGLEDSWAGRDVELPGMADSMLKVFEKLADPAVIDRALAGKSIAKLGVGKSAMLHAMQLYAISKSFGIEAFDQLYEAEKEQISLPHGEKSSKKEAIVKAISKYSHQMTNIKASPILAETWDVLKNEANAKDLHGPQLEGDYFRIAVFDDSKKPLKKGEEFNGQIMGSERVLYGSSRGFGADRIHPLQKTNIVTNAAYGEDGATFSMLTKDSVQYVSSIQGRFNQYGVEYFVPVSALKWPTSGSVKEGMLTIDDIVGSTTGKPKIFKIPVKDFRMTMMGENESTQGNISQYQENGFTGKAAAEFREQFAPDSDNDSGYKAYRGMQKLLSAAYTGDTGAVRAANVMIRTFYGISEQQGIYEDPTFDAIHKNHIFSSLDANPMDGEYKAKTIGFIDSRVMKSHILKRPDSGARNVKMQVSYRDRDEAWAMGTPDKLSFRGEKGERLGGIGTSLGSGYDIDIPLHENTQFAVYDKGADTWVMDTGSGKESFVKMASSLVKGGKRQFSMAFQKHLVNEGVAINNPTGVAAEMKKFMISKGPNNILLPSTASTEGRFYDMMDWMFAGTERLPDGNERLLKSYDYGDGTLKRGGNKIGIVSTWQRTPGFKVNDAVLSVKEGLLPRSHGNVGMLNRHDFEIRSEGDWDYDAMTYMNHLGPEIVKQLIRNSDVKASIDIDAHKDASYFDTNMKLGNLKDWMIQKHHEHKAQGFVGHAQRLNQSYNHVLKAQKYHGWTGEDGKKYFVGPKYRSQQEMIDDDTHLDIPAYIQIFTDSAGKKLSKATYSESWKKAIYNKMFAVYGEKNGLPDFSNELSLVDKPNFHTQVELMMGPYNDLSAALKPASKRGYKNVLDATRTYASRAWGLEKNKNQAESTSMNRYILSRLNKWSDRSLQREFLMSVASDKEAMAEDFGKYYGSGRKLKTDKGGKWGNIWARMMKNIDMSKSIEFTLNPEYMSVREKIAQRVNEDSLILHPDKYEGIAKHEIESLSVLNDYTQQLGGLPSNKAIGDIGRSLYSWKENQAVGIMEEAVADRDRIELELAEYANQNLTTADVRVRGARAERDSLNKYISRAQRKVTQSRWADKSERFILNDGKKGVPGRVKTMNDNDVINRYIGHLSYEKLKGTLAEGQDSGTVAQLVNEADDLNKKFTGMLAGSFKSGKGKVFYKLGDNKGVYGDLTKDVVNRAEAVLTEQFVNKWEGMGLGQLAALAVASRRSNDIEGWWRLNIKEKGADKADMPVYKGARLKALRHLSKQNLGALAQIRAVVRHSISGQTPEASMALFAGDRENAASLLGRSGHPWMPTESTSANVGVREALNRQMITGDAGMPVRVVRGPSPPIVAMDPSEYLIVKVKKNQWEVTSAGRLMEILMENDRYTYKTASQIVSMASLNKNKGLDLTNVDPSHPLSEVAAVYIETAKAHLPTYDVDDQRLMTKWVRNLEKQPKNNPLFTTVTSAFRRDALRNSGPSEGPSGKGAMLPPSDLPPVSGGEGTTGGPSDKSKGYVRPPPIPGGSITAEEKQMVTTRLNRLIKEWSAPDGRVKEMYGGKWDIESWARRVLMKDLDANVMNVKDIAVLETAFERLKTGITRRERMGKGVVWKVAKKLFPSTGATADDAESGQMAKDVEHQEFVRQNWETVYARDINNVSTNLDKLYKMLGYSTKANKAATELGVLEEKQSVLAKKIQNKERAHRLRGTNPAKDQALKELMAKKTKADDTLLAFTEGESPGGIKNADVNNVNHAVVALVESIQEMKGDTIVWNPKRQDVVDSILGNRKMGTKGVFSHAEFELVESTKSVHKFFKSLYPVVEKGFKDYKELMGIRFDQTEVTTTVDDMMKQFLLGSVDGYFPKFNSNFLHDAAWISDFVGSTTDMGYLDIIKGTALDFTGGKGTQNIVHRVGSEEYSKNPLMVMTRYANNAVMFAYKNALELQFTKTIGRLNTRIFNDPDFNHKKFEKQTKNMIQYIEDLRKTTVSMDEGSEFLNKASRYIRGIELVSKLGFRLSTPMRNITQIAAGMAATGVRDTITALKWAKTQEGQDFLGEVIAKGGVGDIESLTTSQKMQSMYTGENPFGDKIDRTFNKLISKMLIPLQKMPIVGEHDARTMLRTVVLHNVYKQMNGDPYWNYVFETRQFSPRMLKAYPELEQFIDIGADGKMQNEGEWGKVWKQQMFNFMRYQGEHLASEVISNIHFGYSMGSRAEALRTPIGAMMLQLKHFSMKNAEMWIRFVDDARSRYKVSKKDGINEGWGTFLKSREGKAMAELGLFTALTQGMKFIVPFGVGWMFRPDFAELISHGSDAIQAFAADDQKAIDKTFYKKGIPQLLAGPVLGDATLFLNILFANQIGDPSNFTKMVAGFRDYQDIDDAEMFHKFARMIGPAAVADAAYYDMPEAIESKGRSIPASLLSQLGFRYRSDEGSVSEKIGEGLMGQYDKIKRKKKGISINRPII